MGENSELKAAKKTEEKLKKAKAKKADEKVKSKDKKKSSSSKHKSSRDSDKTKKETKQVEEVAKCTDPTEQRKKLRLLAKMMKGGNSPSTPADMNESHNPTGESVEFQLPHQHSSRSLENVPRSNFGNRRPKNRRASLDMTKLHDTRKKTSGTGSWSDSSSTITTDDMEGTFHSCISKYSNSSDGTGGYSGRYSSNDEDDDDDDCSVSSSVSEGSFCSAGSVSSVRSARSTCLGRRNVASIPIHVATVWDTVKQQEDYATDLAESVLCEMMRLGPSERSIRQQVLAASSIRSFRSPGFARLARRITDSVDFLVNLVQSPDTDDCDAAAMGDELRQLGIQDSQLFCRALTFALRELLTGEDEFPEDARNAWDAAFESLGAKMAGE